MSSINRIDQAVLLLRDRLEKMASSGSAASKSTLTPKNTQIDSLSPVRQLVRQGQLDAKGVRRALVRAILSSSLGARSIDNLEFQAICDQVSDILEQNDEARALLIRALNELA